MEEIIESNSLVVLKSEPVAATTETLTSVFGRLLALAEDEPLARDVPSSNEEAVAVVKRFIPDERHRIRLHDLIHQEVETLCKELTGENIISKAKHSLSDEDVQILLQAYEVASSRLLSMISAISYHGSDEQAKLITYAIQRLLHRESNNGNWPKLQDYPALLVAYVAGTCAIAGEQYRMLAAVFQAPASYDHLNRDVHQSIEMLNVYHVFDHLHKHLPIKNVANRYTPSNDYLLEVVKPYVKAYIPIDTLAEVYFDIYEYLLSLAYMDRVRDRWAPLGRYKWRYVTWGDHSPLGVYVNRIEGSDSKHPLLQAGMFDSSSERLKEIRTKFWEWAGRVSFGL